MLWCCGVRRVLTCLPHSGGGILYGRFSTVSLAGRVSRTFSPCSVIHIATMGDSYLDGPVKKYVDDYYCMRTSTDNDFSEPTGLSSLGVVDLDTSIAPDVFGLRAFDPPPPPEPISRMLPGKTQHNLRVLVPDAAASPVNFHDIVLEDLRATPEFLARQIVPAEVTSLRRRWPSVVFATMRKCQNDMEGLRRACRQHSEKAYTNGRPGVCPQCAEFSASALDRHMMNNHLELCQLWRCPVEWGAVWKGSLGECLDHLRSKHNGAQFFAVGSLGKFSPHGLFLVISGMRQFDGMYLEWRLM